MKHEKSYKKLKSVKVSEETYNDLTEIGMYKESMDEIITKMVQIYKQNRTK